MPRGSWVALGLGVEPAPARRYALTGLDVVSAVALLVGAKTLLAPHVWPAMAPALLAAVIGRASLRACPWVVAFSGVFSTALFLTLVMPKASTDIQAALAIAGAGALLVVTLSAALGAQGLTGLARAAATRSALARVLPAEVLGGVSGAHLEGLLRVRQREVTLVKVTLYSGQGEGGAAPSVDALAASMAAAVEAIEGQGGVAQLGSGGAVLGIFGAPWPSVAHPRQGVAAALAVRAALDSGAARLAPSDGHALEAFVAVHTGTATVGAIEVEGRLELVVHGPPLGALGEMTALARTRGAALAVCEAARRRGGRRLAVRHLGSIVDDASAGATTVWSVVGDACGRPKRAVPRFELVVGMK